MELIKPQQQKVWKWPAATNFSLGGLGTGFYLVSLLIPLAQDGNWLQLLMQGKDAWLQLFLMTGIFKLLGPGLAGLGFIALTTEAGRPLRIINLFRHLRRSWMSRESLAFFLFGAFAGLDWLSPKPILGILAALTALSLMFCQGMIVYRARGVTAWNSTLLPVYFISAGLATGSGLALIVCSAVAAIFGARPAPIIALELVGILAALANAALWWIYLRTPGDAFQNATAALRRTNALALVLGVGHLLPALLLAFAWVGQVTGALGFSLGIVSGLLLIFGGVAQKFGLILKAGYLRAIVLSAPKRNQAMSNA